MFTAGAAASAALLSLMRAPFIALNADCPANAPTPKSVLFVKTLSVAIEKRTLNPVSVSSTRLCSPASDREVSRGYLLLRTSRIYECSSLIELELVPVARPHQQRFRRRQLSLRPAGELSGRASSSECSRLGRVAR